MKSIFLQFVLLLIAHSANGFIACRGSSRTSLSRFSAVGKKGATSQRSQGCETALTIFEKRVKRKNNAPEPDRVATFNIMESIVGEDKALQMVQSLPEILNYKSNNFKATFDVFAESFGTEEAVGMVTRNPALIAIRPNGYGGADAAGKETLYMSYVVAYTRPLGPVLLGTLFFCLSFPLVEIVTGLSRQEILQRILQH